MSEEGNANDRIEDMKSRFAAEREKYGYSIDDPVEPIINKSGIGRVFLSVFLVAVIVAVLTLVIVAIALENAGSPIELPFIG